MKIKLKNEKPPGGISALDLAWGKEPWHYFILHALPMYRIHSV
jgi:hypothetical protein